MENKLKDIIANKNGLVFNGNLWEYLSPDFKAHLTNYLKIFEQHRSELGLIPSCKNDWLDLPFGNFAKDSSWKYRRQSLSVVQKLLKNQSFDCVLEIGSWNGWLTKHLAQKTKTIIACDYFVCPFDGIGNLQELSKNIIPLQLNVEKIYKSFKPQSFDLIVLNHNLSFMNNPTAFINDLKPLLTSNGMILSIGTSFVKTPERIIKANLDYANSFFQKYNTDLYIQPVKGFMTYDDKQILKNLKFSVKSYKCKLLQNIYSYFSSYASYYCYLIFKNNA